MVKVLIQTFMATRPSEGVSGALRAVGSVGVSAQDAPEGEDRGLPHRQLASTVAATSRVRQHLVHVLTARRWRQFLCAVLALSSRQYLVDSSRAAWDALATVLGSSIFPASTLLREVGVSSARG